MLTIIQAASRRGPITRYEPTVAPDGRTVGAEALARVPGHRPQELLAWAHEHGELAALHRELLADALARRPIGAGWLAVNFEPDVINELAAELAALPAQVEAPLALELTERSAPGITVALAPTLTALVGAGWRLHLDDCDDRPELKAELAVLPVAALKCSRTLTARAMFGDPTGATRPTAARAALSELADRAASIGAEFIVEGIESAAELAGLRRLLPTALAQGWVFTPLSPAGHPRGPDEP